MRVMMVPAGGRPYTTVIPGTLAGMQDALGGHVEVIRPWDDPVLLVCRMEVAWDALMGAEAGRPMDRAFLLCGLAGADFTDFPPGLEEKYMGLMEPGDVP